MWRIDRTADYGAFQDAARGRIDLARWRHPALPFVRHHINVLGRYSVRLPDPACIALLG